MSLFLIGRTQFYNHDVAVGDMLEVLVLRLSTGQISKVAQTHAFNFQQGSMLNWIGQSHSITFNDRLDGDVLVARVVDVESGAERKLPRPIYALTRDGQFATSLDFYRLHMLRRGYGYPASRATLDKSIARRAPDDDGLWIMDLASGSANLVVSYADMARHFKTPSACWLWFNHAQFLHDGDRVVFVVRMKCKLADSFTNLGLFTVARVGRMQSLHRVREARGANAEPSHHDGMGSGHMLLSCAQNQYVLWNDSVQDGQVFWRTSDGHCSFNPIANSIIVSDTYPKPCVSGAISTCPRGRIGKDLFLLDLITGYQFKLGQFESHAEGPEHTRSDLHPRWSPDGRMIAIDSTHTADGRQLFIVDVSSLISEQLSAATSHHQFAGHPVVISQTAASVFDHPPWLQSCRKIYLDVGSNLGVQIRKLYTPEKYPNAPALKLFERHFGAPSERRQPGETSGLCALGMEPHPVLLPRLQKIAEAFRLKGWRVHFYPFAAFTSEGKLQFELRDGVGQGTASSLNPVFTNYGKVKGVAEVRTIDLAAFINSLPTGTVKLMKLDIEGSEFKVVPHLAAEGALCQATVEEAFIEIHPRPKESISKETGWVEVKRALAKARTSAGPCATTRLNDLDDETYAQDVDGDF